MHMSDALLSPAVGATFWTGTLSLLVYCSRKLRTYIDERIIPLMGVLGAFIFASQMINFTIPGTGSSGHLGGGMILAIMLGTHAAFIVIASILTVQAFFFADGGLLALGCNIWNLGVYPCFIAYPLIFKPFVKNGYNLKQIVFGSLISTIVALQLGAFSVVIQTVLSGRSDLPFNTFILFMLPVHFAIGLIEGFVTSGVIQFVKSVRPDILESGISSATVHNRASIRKFLVVFFIFSIVLGGIISWFASEYPDGLEWSIEKVLGSRKLHGGNSDIISRLKSLQEKTAIMPDYNFKNNDKKSPESMNNTGKTLSNEGLSASGIIGSFIVLVFILILGAVIKGIRKKKA